MGHLGDEKKGSAAAQVKIKKEIFGAKCFTALTWQSNSKGGAAPVPGYKRSKWLPSSRRLSCLRKGRVRSAGGRNIPDVLHASIIFLVGKQWRVLSGGNCSLSSNPRGGFSRRLMPLPLEVVNGAVLPSLSPLPPPPPHSEGLKKKKKD